MRKIRKSWVKMSKRVTKHGSRETPRRKAKDSRKVQLAKVALDLVLKILKYDVFFLIPEFIVFAFFEKTDAVFGLAIGTVAMTMGIFSIALSYENYGIISVGKLKIPRMYFLRYAFYAGVFLVSVLISDEKLWGILGTFLGMVNFKIVIFSFGWRWSR